MRKACRKCKAIFEGQQCPVCKGNQSSESWKGRIIVLDLENSEIAKKIKIPSKGEFAIKVG